jgi:hypothetical protein
MILRENTNEERDMQTRRAHGSVLAVIRHIHSNLPHSEDQESDEPVKADAIPVVVGTLNALCAFLMDDGGMKATQAIELLTHWTKAVAEGKEQAAWTLQEPAGHA